MTAYGICLPLSDLLRGAECIYMSVFSWPRGIPCTSAPLLPPLASGGCPMVAVVNNSAVHLSFQVSVLGSLNKYPKVGLPGHVRVLFLIC